MGENISHTDQEGRAALTLLHLPAREISQNWKDKKKNLIFFLKGVIEYTELD